MQENQVISIAFADDHEAMREALIFYLNVLGGLRVEIQANDGVELLEKLTAAKPLPDICMIDIQMPRMDGHSLLLEIKKRWPQMKVLVLTAFDNEDLIIRMIKAGANGYILKNCKPDMIKEALQVIHVTGYYYSQQASSTVFHLVGNNILKAIHFTENETEFIKQACTDLTYAEIAIKLGWTAKSIEGCRDRVCNKLNVTSRAGIIIYALQSGIVPLEINTAMDINFLKSKKHQA